MLGMSSSLGLKVPCAARWRRSASKAQGQNREGLSEGSAEQNRGPPNRNRIRGRAGITPSPRHASHLWACPRWKSSKLKDVSSAGPPLQGPVCRRCGRGEAEGLLLSGSARTDPPRRSCLRQDEWPISGTDVVRRVKSRPLEMMTCREWPALPAERSNQRFQA